MVKAPLSLYFHTPFCQKKCDYCHFYVVKNSKRLSDNYILALEKEISLRSSVLKEHSIASVYFGGGTPSLLGPENIAKILSWLTFSPSVEVTLEANPDDVTFEKMQAFKSAGINRVSIGVQSLDDTQLKNLSRQHSASQAKEAAVCTYNAGIDNISIDLMYDLPHQTLDVWKKTLKAAVKLPISHLSLYNLTIEPNTIFFKKKSLLKPHLPDPETSYQMYEMARQIFEESGLKQYEISAFARNNKISEHNTGYWTARPFLGFGPSAFSYYQDARFSNIANINKYCQMLNNDKLPIDFEERLCKEAKERELLAVNLRLLKGVDKSRFNFDPALCQSLFSQGLLEKTDSHIRLSQKGILFYDTLASEIVLV